MTAGPEASDLEFYWRALDDNEAGNNHARAQQRPRRHAWSFERPAGPARPLACSLQRREHRGKVVCWWYIDSKGEAYFQVFCEGCAPRHWERLDSAELAGRLPRSWRKAALEASERSILDEEV